MARKRSDKTENRHLRRDLRAACKLLDLAAADLSTCVRAMGANSPLDPSSVRQRSSDYALSAWRLTPGRRK